jgi:hypothetical protein
MPVILDIRSRLLIGRDSEERGEGREERGEGREKREGRDRGGGGSERR